MKKPKIGKQCIKYCYKVIHFWCGSRECQILLFPALCCHFRLDQIRFFYRDGLIFLFPVIRSNCEWIAFYFLKISMWMYRERSQFVFEIALQIRRFQNVLKQWNRLTKLPFDKAISRCDGPKFYLLNLTIYTILLLMSFQSTGNPYFESGTLRPVASTYCLIKRQFRNAIL